MRTFTPRVRPRSVSFGARRYESKAQLPDVTQYRSELTPIRSQPLRKVPREVIRINPFSDTYKTDGTPPRSTYNATRSTYTPVRSSPPRVSTYTAPVMQSPV